MSWPTTPARFLLTEVDERGLRDGEDGELLSVSEYHGVIPRSGSASQQAASEDVSHYKRCERGQLVLNRLWAFRGGLGVSLHTGLVSPDYAVFDINPQVDPRFVHYQVRSAWFVAEMSKRLRGIGSPNASLGRAPRINVSDLGRIEMHTPPIELQRRIADLLDVETARIDTLIAKNQRVRRLLDHRFWAEVDQVVHRGVGDVGRFGEHKVWEKHPAHWTTTTLGRAAESMIDGPFGSSLTSAHYTDEGRQVVRLGNIGRAAFKNTEQAFIPEDHYQTLKAHAVRAGDLVIGGLGDDASEAPAGRACVVPETFDEGIVKADCYRVRLHPWLRHDYAAWALSSPSQVAFAGAKARGATRPRLNLALASQLPMPVPSLREQAEIAAHLACQRERLMEMQARLIRQIELLRRRRQAFVTAAVTGQIDV